MLKSSRPRPTTGAPHSRGLARSPRTTCPRAPNGSRRRGADRTHPRARACGAGPCASATGTPRARVPAGQPQGARFRADRRPLGHPFVPEGHCPAGRLHAGRTQGGSSPPPLSRARAPAVARRSTSRRRGPNASITARFTLGPPARRDGASAPAPRGRARPDLEREDVQRGAVRHARLDRVTATRRGQAINQQVGSPATLPSRPARSRPAAAVGPTGSRGAGRRTAPGVAGAHATTRNIGSSRPQGGVSLRAGRVFLGIRHEPGRRAR